VPESTPKVIQKLKSAQKEKINKQNPKQPQTPDRKEQITKEDEREKDHLSS